LLRFGLLFQRHQPDCDLLKPFQHLSCQRLRKGWGDHRSTLTRRQSFSSSTYSQFRHRVDPWLIAVFNPTSEVETADDADDADKQELGGETGRMSPKLTLSMKPVSHP
jgi:hypothetical protein